MYEYNTLDILYLPKYIWEVHEKPQLALIPRREQVQKHTHKKREWYQSTFQIAFFCITAT